jgi:hypothetical protein
MVTKAALTLTSIIFLTNWIFKNVRSFTPGPFSGAQIRSIISTMIMVQAQLHGHDVAFPTEFLHGLYDGGAGAGLDDFWELMWHTPISAGGFIWDFADEAVVRTDKNNELDSDGDHAA